MRVNRKSSARRVEPYHHGDLSRALVAAAEQLLAERGIEGFTLRECARRAGVSHAAPAHHFGDIGGLLTEVAASGFERLTASIIAAKGRERDATKRMLAGHLAYVQFAVAHPALFRLMFHSKYVNRNTERIRSAGGAAFATLNEAISGLKRRTHQALRAPEAWRDSELLEQWSLVHGLATLAIEGQLGPNLPRKRLVAAARATLELSVNALRARDRRSAG
jgi:AcrR family transcriptional regulator